MFYIAVLSLPPSPPPGVEQDLEEPRALHIKIKGVRRVGQNLQAYLKFLIGNIFHFSSRVAKVELIQ